jgi:replicative DNA helicase
VEESLSMPNDAEVKVLGGLLHRPESLARVVELLHPEDFARERHQMIYAAVLSLSEEHSPISAQTVCEALEQRENLGIVGGSEYLASLGQPIEEQELIELAAAIQRRAEARRRLLSAGERIQQLAQVEQDEAIAFDKATQLLAQAKRNPSTFASPLGELLVECTQELSQLRTRSGKLTGVPTGFVDLDALTDGLQPCDMIMVAAPPASGKTSFVLSIALHAALSTRRPIGMFSMELNRKRLVQRLLAISGQTELYRLRTGKLEHEEWERVVAASEQLTKEAGMWIDDTADLSTEQLRQRARHLVEQEHVALIIVDYLHLMQATVSGKRLEQRAQEVEEISRVLKVIARELNIPVLVVAQLFRAVESRPLEKSRFSELRGGFLENDADLMLILYRDELYTRESSYRNMVKIIVAKQRNGPVADFYVSFQPEQTRFSDLLAVPEEGRRVEHPLA